MQFICICFTELNQILVPLETLSDFCLPIECSGVACLNIAGGDICIWEQK